MPPQYPLTHHEILALAEPFVRGGRQVDLAASDRIGRRLVFKPVEHAGDAPGSPGLRETLQLDNADPGRFVLTRFASIDGGPQASLQATGAEPRELLARVSAVEATVLDSASYRRYLERRQREGHGG